MYDALDWHFLLATRKGYEVRESRWTHACMHTCPTQPASSTHPQHHTTQTTPHPGARRSPAGPRGPGAFGRRAAPLAAPHLEALGGRDGAPPELFVDDPLVADRRCVPFLWLGARTRFQQQQEHALLSHRSLMHHTPTHIHTYTHKISHRERPGDALMGDPRCLPALGPHQRLPRRRQGHPRRRALLRLRPPGPLPLPPLDRPRPAAAHAEAEAEMIWFVGRWGFGRGIGRKPTRCATGGCEEAG